MSHFYTKGRTDQPAPYMSFPSLPCVDATLAQFQRRDFYYLTDADYESAARIDIESLLKEAVQLRYEAGLPVDQELINKYIHNET